MKIYFRYINYLSTHSCVFTIPFRKFSATKILFESKPFNPFGKKLKTWYNFDDPGPIANRICITIFGNGALGQPRCIGLFTNCKAFLFNCGEGVGRLCKEYEVNTYNIRNIFITQKNWRNVSGLADIFLSNETYGVHKMNIYGPPGVEHFLSVISSNTPHLSLRKQYETYTDENIEINPIPLQMESNSPTLKKNYINNNEDTVFCYSCKIFGKIGELLPEKCVELGVPIGSHLLKLKNGEDVTLPSGRIIRYQDVTDSSTSTATFLIVDCPSEKHLDLIVRNEIISQYQISSNKSNDVSVIFHFTPSHIIQSTKYKNFMEKFHNDVEHYVLNSSNPTVSSETVHHTQMILHKLHPSFFKLLPDQQKSLLYENTHKLNIFHPPPMLQLYFRPKKKLDWCNVVVNDPNANAESIINNILPSIEFKGEKNYHNEYTGIKNIFPEVVFLGTSSASSTAYRNVSAILVNIDINKSIMMDCGEGTFMQFARYYGSSDVHAMLRKLSCIFVTHMHTDHYMGLFELIRARIEAFEKDHLPYQTVSLILPTKINDILRRFSDIFEPLIPKVRIFSCKSLVCYNEKRKAILPHLNKFLGNAEIETVPVIHCEDSYGAVLKVNSKCKIVYSGDTAPCQKLIDAGKDCTLLIHESSIEDSLINEATVKKHCTPTQVVDIAEKMNSKYTIMTHFSKRYLAVPVIQKSEYKNIGFAFDFMKVNLSDLCNLPKILPSIQNLFQEQLDNNLEKTSFAVNFQNIFLKSYRSRKYN